MTTPKPLWIVNIYTNVGVIHVLTPTKPDRFDGDLGDSDSKLPMLHYINRLLKGESVPDTEHGETLIELDPTSVVNVSYRRAPIAVEEAIGSKPTMAHIVSSMRDRQSKTFWLRTEIADMLGTTSESIKAVLDVMVHNGQLYDRRDDTVRPYTRQLSLYPKPDRAPGDAAIPKKDISR